MREFSRDGLVFDVSDEGPPDGDVVLLLHGWPQDRRAWSGVATELHRSGLRSVAFDQRGYSPRARPAGRAAYRMRELVADVVAAHHACGVDRVHLVGHDWGGAVAWAVAERHPELLHSLTVVSTPHHRALAAAVRRGDQARRSWYIAAFQLPWLPEAVLRRRLPAVLRRTGLPDEHAQRYAAAFREPGAAGGGLAWYRALPSGALTRARGRILARGNAIRPGGPDNRRIRVPTTFLWGAHDPALGRAAAEGSGQWVAADYRFVEVDAGHWLPETHPQLVAQAVLDRALDPA